MHCSGQDSPINRTTCCVGCRTRASEPAWVGAEVPPSIQVSNHSLRFPCLESCFCMYHPHFDATEIEATTYAQPLHHSLRCLCPDTTNISVPPRLKLHMLNPAPLPPPPPPTWFACWWCPCVGRATTTCSTQCPHHESQTDHPSCGIGYGYNSGSAFLPFHLHSAYGNVVVHMGTRMHVAPRSGRNLVLGKDNST